MSLVNKTFAVNVTPGMMPPIVHVSEYDVGRAYTVSILDEQGNTFTIPSGTTASIEGTLNGSVGFTQSATVSNNQVSFTLSQSMTAYSGKAWCKIKLTQNSQPIQTCAFVLAVDRAGVEADTVIGAPGFEEQIVNAVNDWLDEHPPSGGGGLTDDVKQALLDCFENVAWINDDGQTYYDALYTALHPPANLVSISAVFTQESAVIYDTDSLDALKQYLVVTAHYSDSSTGNVANYALSGTLAVGTSIITVSYGGKTTTFSVTVVEAQFVGSEYITVANEAVLQGYINDSGEFAERQGSELIDKFYSALPFALGSNNRVVSGTLRGAYYNASNVFLSRDYANARVKTPAESAAYQKIGWDTNTPSYVFLLNLFDSSAFVNSDSSLDPYGEIISSSGQSATDFIAIPSNCNKFVLPLLDGSIIRIAFYNSAKTFISRFYNATADNTNSVFYGDIPANAAYFRMDKPSSTTVYHPLAKGI